MEGESQKGAYPKYLSTITQARLQKQNQYQLCGKTPHRSQKSRPQAFGPGDDGRLRSQDQLIW